MKIALSNIPKYIIKFIFIIWILGITPLAFQLILISGFFLILSRIKKNKIDLVCFMLIVLLLIQLFSFSLSFRFDFFTFNRGIASFRNILNFSLLISGYVFCQNYNFKQFFIRHSSKLFYLLVHCSLIAFILGLIHQNDIIFDSLLSKITGISWFNVSIVRMGWLGELYYPRSIVFSTYPNGTALLIFCSFIIFRAFQINKFNLKFNINYLFLFLGVFATGSRIVLVCVILIYLIDIYEKRKKIFKTAFYILIVCFIVFFNQIYNYIEYLVYLRQGSTNTRFQLYINSIDFFMKHSPIIGLGFKPKLEYIAGGVLPVGSHSSIIGYFVKTGILGGAIFLFGFLYFILKPISYVLWAKVRSIHTVFSTSFIFMSTSLLFLIYLFEDFDASEFLCFLTGIILYIHKNENYKFK